MSNKVGLDLESIRTSKSETKERKNKSSDTGRNGGGGVEPCIGAGSNQKRKTEQGVKL